MSCFNVTLPPVIKFRSLGISLEIPALPIPTFPNVPGLPNLPVPPTIKIPVGIGIGIMPPLPNMIGGGVPCCNFQVPIPYLDQVLAAMNAALSVSLLGQAPVLAEVMAAINVYVNQANQTIVSAQAAIPPCKLNASAITG